MNESFFHNNIKNKTEARSAQVSPRREQPKMEMKQYSSMIRYYERSNDHMNSFNSKLPQTTDREIIAVNESM